MQIRSDRRYEFDEFCSTFCTAGKVVRGGHSWLLANPDVFGEVLGESPAVLAAELALCHRRLCPGEVRAVARQIPSTNMFRLTVVAGDRAGLLADTAATLADEHVSVVAAAVATWPARRIASGLLSSICRWFADHAVSIEAADVTTVDGMANDEFLLTGAFDTDELPRHPGEGGRHRCGCGSLLATLARHTRPWLLGEPATR